MSEPLDEEPLPLVTQVGGHRQNKGKGDKGMLQYHDLVLKPLEQGNRAEKELHFYQAVFNHEDPVLQRIHDFVPAFHGTIKFTHEGALTDYLKLENITYPFKSPSVLDLKMGTQTYDENASPEKIAVETAKYPPQKELGFRFTGMKIHQVNTGETKEYDRFYGRDLEASNVLQGFTHFLHNGREVRYDLIPSFLAALREILAWFEEQRHYRFYSSSLLLVYEGSDEGAGPNDSAAAPGATSAPPKTFSRSKVDVRLIDFGHATLVTDNKADEGFIHGLKKAISCFTELLLMFNKTLN